MDPDLATRDYRHLLIELVETRVNARFLNGMPGHIPVFFETMFQHAQGQVRIFAEGFGVLEDRRVAVAMRQFIWRPGARLKLLLQNPVGYPQSIQALSPFVEVKKAVGTYAAEDAKRFAVMDDCGFRFEHSPERVVANFNERDTARTLIAAFDKAFAMGSVYPIATS